MILSIYDNSIIWTMWDIKRGFLLRLHIWFRYWYYLNHVGYKGSIQEGKGVRAEACIIWTMWDIKGIAKPVCGLPVSTYYLNHVGYKVDFWVSLSFFSFGIIWTMWDIKFACPCRSGKKTNSYYLNHVGYKVHNILLNTVHCILYYLNHVGYKVCSPVSALVKTIWYYLNHVGYKDCRGDLSSMISLRIIWTMWDIKCFEPCEGDNETKSIIWTMWDIKDANWTAKHLIKFPSIIWTMWDIKLRDWEENALAAEETYYLNHVGYKVIQGQFSTLFLGVYYLNHVGYKEILALFMTEHHPRIIWTMWDIKKGTLRKRTSRIRSIIWTMWDIKSKLTRLTKTGHPSYYLNHVGYKGSSYSIY